MLVQMQQNLTPVRVRGGDLAFGECFARYAGVPIAPGVKDLMPAASASGAGRDLTGRWSDHVHAKVDLICLHRCDRVHTWPVRQGSNLRQPT